MYDLINLGIELDIILDDDQEKVSKNLGIVAEGVEADHIQTEQNIKGMRDIKNKNPFQKIMGLNKNTTDDQGSVSLGRVAERQKEMLEKIKNA